MNRKIIGIFVSTLFFIAASSAIGAINAEIDKIEETNLDACSSLSSSKILPKSLDRAFEFEYDVQTPTGDNGCLGVEFDGEFFWVTGRDSPSGDIHKLHKFDSTGNHIITYEQGTSSVCGWRDLAWDGDYLYASDEDELAKIDPADGTVVEILTKPDVVPVARGLAVNPANGHFFTANWASPIYEFNPADGTIYNTYNNGYSIYGLAYDDFSNGGPFLWVYSQDPDVNPQVQISKFDLTSGTYTGVIYEGYWDPSYDSNMAGGACFYVDGTDPIFVGLTQASPDTIFGLNVEVVNNPPGAPTITGPPNGKTGTSYDYKFNAVDPDGDDVKYHIDWGDTNPEVTGFGASGTDVTAPHTWSADGTYNITAYAEDSNGLTGPSNTLVVTMPRNKEINAPFLQFLENHPNLFPLLQMLLQRLGLQ